MRFKTHSSATRFVLAFLVSAPLLPAEVKPNPLFSEGAVLQRGQPVPVWGTARAGEKVSVEFDGQKLETTAADDGSWKVMLQPLKEGPPRTMTLRGDNMVTLRDLLVGEVWICSGQSNMAWQFNRIDNAREEGPKADYPRIRMFTVPKKTSARPLSEASGRWVACSPATVGDFSAVGYFFARDLHKKLRVPVGMIHTSWGGTPAEAWTSLEGFAGHPELDAYAASASRRLTGYEENLATHAEKEKAYQEKNRQWEATVGAAYQKSLGEWNRNNALAKKAGTPPPAKPAPSAPRPKAPPHPDGASGDPAALFNAMVAPVIPYGIKGAIWYQGESNAKKARQYRTLFPALIADWRKRWGLGDFPFYFVQIAPHNTQPPEIREAQFLTLSKVKNTAMAVITDHGNANNIHPLRKEPVGQRLALAARALTYGENIEYSGPLYESMERDKDRIVLRFSHVGKGLVAKGGDLKGFTIAGEDGRFVPARAEIRGSTVVVSAEGVTAPKAARYGWAAVPDVNLFNKEGLPASPFRTDVD